MLSAKPRILHRERRSRTGRRPGPDYTFAPPESRFVSLFKAASTVALLTLASRITGLVRDLLMAAAFGVSGLTDAFNVAFRIPNLLRRLFGEGAFSQAFVPVLASSRARDGEAAWSPAYASRSPRSTRSAASHPFMR